MRKITEIIVHTTATRASWMEGNATSAKVAEIRRWHVKDNGWSDIGYHLLIDRDGTIASGRPIERDGAHTKGRNTGTIGVALIGGHGGAETDQFSDHYTAAQEASLVTLINDLNRRFGKLALSGHNQWAAKACPCFNVPKWWAARSGAPVVTDDCDHPDVRSALAKIEELAANARKAMG